MNRFTGYTRPKQKEDKNGLRVAGKESSNQENRKCKFIENNYKRKSNEKKLRPPIGPNRSLGMFFFTLKFSLPIQMFCLEPFL